ncbi:hypothetical protein KDJ21_015710 [Metabacillus litoralis]|uniref:hypothetical protein n=1 Tax=Metabacillus TaxID=2675233 RepID=UPI000EF563C8|nr:hypothetical protein [Metabacillus litoralis]MCM3163879.1 hypothetical protein [Metabacillus litoralis]MCM3410608.1 hypothetical protein [Metabacillus litoralis]UHA58305.1 hypothetical protein KDJ21_015710 [Metabacillus litoralis]
MVNENFDQFIKTEAKHEAKYLGSTQPSHGKYKNISESNTRGETNESVGAVGRDVYDEENK